jgi:DNA-binding MarR family transcriptional regulator
LYDLVVTAQADAEIDPVVLVAALDAVFRRRVLDASRSAVSEPVRASDGYVFQHLVVAPLTISELGRRLGVSQQRASVQVADLEGRGLVRLDRDPDDARRRLVHLTDEGHEVIEAARRERQAIVVELEAVLGRSGWRTFRRALAKAAGGLGATEVVEGRRFAEEDG